MSGLVQDLRYALRQLRKSPGFTAVAVITLALGIGVNAAIFSIVNFMLLRPLPVAKPDQVHYLAYRTKGDWNRNFSYSEFELIREQTKSLFSDTAAAQLFQMDGFSWNGNNQPIWTDYVTGNFFNVLGVRPALGRLIQPTEGKSPGADPVIVLSFAFWKTHFHSDPGIIGEQANINGRPVTVIGVAPEGFRGLSALVDTQGYLPLSMATSDGQRTNLISDRKAHELFLLGRLLPGVNVEQSEAALQPVAHRLSELDPDSDAGLILHASHLDALGPVTDTDAAGSLAVAATLFLTLAGLVLGVACFNVANLLLVRATVRRREMTIRAALGAARWRLIRQLFFECLMLASAGSVFGILLGGAATRALHSIPLGTNLPVTFDLSFDWRVFAYVASAAFLCTLIVGVAPGLQAVRVNLNETLRESARSVSPGRQRFRNLLVVAQVASSLTLLIVASLFVRSLRNIQRIELGFDPRHVLNVTLDPRQAGLDEAQSRVFYRQLLERISALPGVESASLAASVPFSYNNYGAEVDVQSNIASAEHQLPTVGFNALTADYFRTMNMRVIGGRSFDESDTETSLKSVIVNEAMAKHYWSNENAVGKSFVLGRNHRRDRVQIVGVLANARTTDLSGPVGDFIYAPMSQYFMSTQTLQVRTVGSPESVAADVIATVRSLSPNLPMLDLQPMASALLTLNGVLTYEIGTAVTACLGGLGLLLAIVGLYGVLSYVVAQRTHEIGIRMALGAARPEVAAMILRGSLRIVIPGLIAGLLLSIGLTRLLGSFLVRVSATDLATYGVVSVGLGLLSLGISYIPARRAARVDPIVALRYE